ncbi:TVP38/TMEM64 family protein [Halobacillus rhizosphaerae]|uniref:TVP38/TMEM64 family protein n=1 Tax=Halobacillus rhizosphaerae TaxID=3064889 RepID=UPI00398B9F58
MLLNKLFFHIKPSNVADWMEDLGFWAPIIFLLIFTIRPFTLIPLSIFAVACGIVFGPYMGSVYIVIGTVLGGTASFFALKYFSKEIHIQDKNKQNVSALKSELEKNGFKSVLMLRLLPAINFDLLTYICAKTQVTPWKYIAATAVGTLPGSLMLGFFGSSLLSLKPMNLTILAGIIILLVVLGIMMKKNVSKKYNTEKLKEEIKDLRKSA